MSRKHPSQAGFTLVELSIVLVILGLLVGGVLSGQTLIHSAELRAVTTEARNYQTALGTFRDKYFSLPGDMPNATAYWGEAHATYATCILTESTTSATCNGDGNGLISFWAEGFHAWKHLANAGFIEGNYTGTPTQADSDARAGVNIPRSKFPQASWNLPDSAQLDSIRFNTVNYFGASLVLGAYSNGEMAAFDPILLPEDALNIDTKMDDGRPGTGKVLSLTNAYNPNCTPADGSAYILTTTTPACTMYFITGY